VTLDLRDDLVLCASNLEPALTSDQQFGHGPSLSDTKLTAVARRIKGFDVEGPVQAEVFVLYLKEGAPQLTGPCGAAPWYIETHEDDDPVEVVARLVRGNIGEPIVVHSTSWRRGRDAVILSFVVVVGAEQAAGMESAPVNRSPLARSGATTAPASIDTVQVVEHGLRHLAWLVKDDPVVSGELTEWKEVLAGYVPEPFRHLG
jgi:hypothetical protein